MEVKKSPKADLEKGKAMGVLMGMIVGLAVLFVGFEWSDREITIVQDQGVADIIAEEEVEITRPEDAPPPPPPPPAPAVAEVLNVVEDDVKLDDVEIVSSEDDSATAQVEAYTPPAVVEEEDESSCSFVVNKDGSIVDAEVIRGVDPSLDKEALRVINSMPKWSPGKQRGKPVRVKYTVPVTFRLQ